MRRKEKEGGKEREENSVFIREEEIWWDKNVPEVSADQGKILVK